MKRHEQLIIQDRRNTDRIKRALRESIQKLTSDQLGVFIQYMKTEKNRMGYETCTPMKMMSQLRKVGLVSISTKHIQFTFRGSYGDSLRMIIPSSFVDNAEGRQKTVDRLKSEMEERIHLKKNRDIHNLRCLSNRYPEIVKEIAESK